MQILWVEQYILVNYWLTFLDQFFLNKLFYQKLLRKANIKKKKIERNLNIKNILQLIL